MQNPRQDAGQRNISYTRYLEKCFTQIYGDLYEDAMLVPIRMGTNMADEKYVTKFCYKRVNLFLEELMNI